MTSTPARADIELRRADRIYCSFESITGVPEDVGVLEARFGKTGAWHTVPPERKLLVHGPDFTPDGAPSVLIPASCEVWLRVTDTPEQFADPVGVIRVI